MPGSATNDIDVKVVMNAAGRVEGARAVMRLDAPASRVWALVEDVDGYAGRVPMISRVIRRGDRATLQLKFKLSLFSVGFEFVVDIVRSASGDDGARSLELRWVSGEPEGIVLGYELVPLDGGQACELRARGEFDLARLGWFAKFFLRHHPEIELGVLPGVAIGLLDAVRRAASS